jgi:hypothetical protein
MTQICHEAVVLIVADARALARHFLDVPYHHPRDVAPVPEYRT